MVCGCLLATSAGAQSPAYEADLGLIFVGGFILFYDSQGPLSYQTYTPQESPDGAVSLGEVAGDSCQHGLSIPIIFSAADRFSVSGAKGDGSFKKALRDLHQKHPEVDGIYDVKVDVHQLSILGIYKRACTEVAARGFRRARPEEGAASRTGLPPGPDLQEPNLAHGPREPRF